MVLSRRRHYLGAATTLTASFLFLLVAAPTFSWAWFFASQPASLARSTLPRIPPNVRILILPGFGNNANDYLQAGSLVDSLQKRGWSSVADGVVDDNDGSGDTLDAASIGTSMSTSAQVRVLPIERTDWLKVFLRGCLDIKFWQNTADPTRPAFRWYLDCVAAEVEQLTSIDADDSAPVKVVLVGHSAGGWLGRAAMGYLGASTSAAAALATGMSSNGSAAAALDLTKIVGLVTLGAPHFPPPPNIMDMTRGALRLTNEDFPGAYHDDNLFYLTVVGDAVRGVPQVRNNPWERTSVTGFAYNSYDAVCGNGQEIGDGVVPQCSAHLEGALQLNLPGIYHSINAPDKWYGSDGVIDMWHTDMLRLIDERLRKSKRGASLAIGQPSSIEQDD